MHETSLSGHSCSPDVWHFGVGSLRSASRRENIAVLWLGAWLTRWRYADAFWLRWRRFIDTLCLRRCWNTDITLWLKWRWYTAALRRYFVNTIKVTRWFRWPAPSKTILYRCRSRVNFGALGGGQVSVAWKYIYVRKINNMPKFYIIFARKITKFPNFTWY